MNKVAVDNNCRIRTLIAYNDWDMHMVDCFIPDGHTLVNKILFSDKEPTEEQYEALSWLLWLPIEFLKGSNDSNEGTIYMWQPVLPDQTYMNMQSSFDVIYHYHLNSSMCRKIGLSSLMFSRLADDLVNVNKLFIDRFMNKYNEYTHTNVSDSYFFKPRKLCKENNTKDNAKEIINQINKAILSPKDLHLISQYCETEAKHKEILLELGK